MGKSYIKDDGETRELDDAWFKNARRGRGRPPMPSDQVKEKITIRLDRDVVMHYRSTGKNWQRRINEALRKSITQDPAE